MIDEKLDDIIRDETAQTKAVSSLIEVKNRVKGELGSDVELKTDLTDQQTAIHTQAGMLSFILQKAGLTKLDIISNLVELKERKLLSLKRKSREEIVNVARTPDMQQFVGDAQSFGKRFITPRR